MHIGDYEKALDYYDRSLVIVEEMGDKQLMGIVLGNIGLMHKYKRNLDTALDYFDRSLSIAEEMGDKRGVGKNLRPMGDVYCDKGDLNTALDYYERTLEIAEKLGDKFGEFLILENIGVVHADRGDYDKALDYYNRMLASTTEYGEKLFIGYSLTCIGFVHYNKGSYEKALEHLEKSLAIQQEIGFKELELETTTYLYLTYKHLGKDYDVNEIHSLIKETMNLEFELNYTLYALYELLEDKSYLETAYNQVQDKVSVMEENLAKKYLSYPIPKAIVEAWEKVK
jgi:tetratricopeptide (TPR) repeat protein